MKNLILGSVISAFCLFAQSPARAQANEGPNGPTYNCSTGCTIVTCNASTCTVTYCDTSGCRVVSTYKRPTTAIN